MFFKKKEANNPALAGLTEKARKVISDSGLAKQRARVALAIDLSATMGSVITSDLLDRVCERVLALAVHFDDNCAIDIFVFGEKREFLGELNPDNFDGFVDREILTKFQIAGDTNFAPIMEKIIKKYTAEKGDPAYVMFVTNGECKDQQRTRKLIMDTSTYPIFWQVIGIGDIDYRFLKELDNMGGRAIDNLNFFQLNDIDKVDDDELFRRLLQEFPRWIQAAKKLGLVK